MSRFTLLSIFLVIGLSCFGQNKKMMRKAEKMFDEYAYAGAIELYLKLHEKETSDEVKVRLAECYTKLNSPKETEKWYDMVDKKAEMSKQHHYNYAQALISNGKLDKAKEWLEVYHNEALGDTRYKEKLSGLDHMTDYYKDSSKYHVMSMEFNSEQADFAPAFFDKGIAFVSSRIGEVGTKHTFKWDNSAFLDVYFADREGDSISDKYTEPKKFDGKINTKYHEGPLCFNKDFTKVIFTRNTYFHSHTKKSDEGITKISLYQCDKTQHDNGTHGWHHVRELQFDDPNYSYGDPTLDESFSTLIFASDMPGGFGGTDLWKSTWNEEKEEWGKPVNLGDSVNTEGNERFPFLHKDGTLYFSSDGHGGIGGLDIYESHEVNGLYQQVTDMGYPINTRVDDFGLIYDDHRSYGYFASNREGGKGGDDIYKFVVDQIQVEGITFINQEGHPETERRIKPNCKVKVIDKTHDYVYEELTTDVKGKFTIGLNKGLVYEFIAYEDSLLPDTFDLSLVENKEYREPVELTILEVMPEKVAFELTFLDKDTREELKDVSVYLMNVETGEVAETRTDNDGRVYADLDPESGYVVKGSKLKYLSECVTFRTPTKSDELHTTKEPILLELVKLNQKMILENVYFDLAKWNIRKDAAVELDKVVSFLSEHPGVAVELGSHTDCRGSDSYNESLSQKRAESSVDYIVSRGIDRSFITAKGYGENQLTNECDDGVNCSEEQHQANRRTEIKITGITELSPEQQERFEKEKNGLSMESDTSDCDLVDIMKKEGI